MTLEVTNMTCNHCVRTITLALMKEKIVSEINLQKQTVTVDDSHGIEKVTHIIKEAGYQVK